ncbi:uncharacterized protein LOC122388713 [Amphibalanus amphitrite]|uniref:uncharacterized protein LOC122381552 n=1 Tax=Amphibalanus amphitrite TaxID=1232801 RepID=UPI001C90403E|nr:uncharacterized protein LOC122381552 [Amphibalanus amphitrite]XP_043236005.1 uncharacterized protein LOC122388713 [Amphibalanus amphitrite]XP_043236006.1 uncharacterized protein LOC122388713 [Amphibalanus amphitrite]
MVSTGPVSTACPSTADTDTIELVETVQLATGTGLKTAQPAHCRPLSRVLRIRVFQIFCGIGCMIMAAVAFIEEKRFNLAIGLVSGALTVFAASASIQNSSCFDTVCNSWNMNFKRTSRSQIPNVFSKAHRPALGVAISWLVAGVGNTALMVVTGLTLRRGHLSDTLLILCVIEIVLVAGLSLSAALVVWIDYRVLREHAV